MVVVLGWVVVGWCVGDHFALLGRREVAVARCRLSLSRDGGRVVVVVVAVVEVGTDGRSDAPRF